MKNITSTKNSYIKMLRSLKSKKGREEQGLFVAEGEKITLEALNSDFEIHSVITCNENGNAALKAQNMGIEVFLVQRGIIESISDAKTPQDTLAVIKQRKMQVNARDFVVALDGVSDPKNLGTIIRTADAVGAQGVFLSESCVDIYNPKTIRATMGSIFHINCAVGSITEFLQSFNGIIVGGHLKGRSEITPSKNTCLVIGNEARGISDEVSALCNNLYKIPIYGKAESLNAAVAAGIMMYEIKKGIINCK